MNPWTEWIIPVGVPSGIFLVMAKNGNRIGNALIRFHRILWRD